MITAAQEQRLSDANSRSKRKQDKQFPMVINIDDGRLMPNTERLRLHAKYRVYTGSLDAPLPERMRWIKQAGRTAVQVTNSKAAEDAFDVGTASAADLVVFANEQWGALLDEAEPLAVLRKKVMAMAEKDAAGDDLS